jgi:hypothetical protein
MDTLVYVVLLKPDCCQKCVSGVGTLVVPVCIETSASKYKKSVNMRFGSGGLSAKDIFRPLIEIQVFKNYTQKVLSSHFWIGTPPL